MKTLTFIFALILLATGVLVAQSNFHNIHYLDPYNPEYVKGEVLVKFKDEIKVEKSLRSGIAITGISSVDKVLEPYQVETISKVFKETREQRNRKTTRTIRDFKGNEIEVPALFNIYKLSFDTIWDAKHIIEELQKDESIEFAEPNYLVYTNEVMESGIIPDTPPKFTPLPANKGNGNRDTEPNDPLYQDGSQWYLDAINAPAAWDSTTGDTTQIIAIIDTGVDWDHPDLDDNIWTNWNEIPDNGIDDDNNGYIDDTRGWDYINNDNAPNDDNSHGTHVAGIAAAEGNNGIGICGVAWNARIMPVKMLQSSGSGNSSDLASAIEYASDNGATVINMSLGSYGESQVVKTALENAYAYVVLIAAAGNDGYKVDPPYPPQPIYAPHYPACYSFVIGVEATNQSGNLAGFSNFDPSGPVIAANPYGHNYEMKAPGVGINSTFPNGHYNSLSGTSMASPIVAGAVALMMNYNTSQSKEQLFAKLIQGSNSGILDIYNSMECQLIPGLHFVDFTIVDTLTGCDNDGKADTGETIEIYLTIKNGGGWADSVWSKLRFGPYEDTTIANIIDSTSYIGDISAYATLTGGLDPFKIEIDQDLVNNRNIVFEYEVGSENSSPINGEFIITVQNGTEVGGIIFGNEVWTPENMYLVVDNIRIDENSTLTVEPGTHIKLYPDKSIEIRGKLNMIGTKDSLIVLTSNNSDQKGMGLTINSFISDSSFIKYTKFTNLNKPIFKNSSTNFYWITNNIFNYNSNGLYSSFIILRGYNYDFSYNLITNNISYIDLSYFPQTVGLFKSNVITHNFSYQYILKAEMWNQNYYDNMSDNNSIYGNFNSSNPISLGCEGDGSYLPFRECYWGNIDSSYIKEIIYDFFDNPMLPIAIISPYLNIPSFYCHGHAWKVEINNILVNIHDNPYNSPTGLGVVGAETLKFDVYFNRPMDTTYTPFLTFGVREPYTQQIVIDSASWSADSTIWTAYKTIDETTGDGIQRVRVDGARDDERFEIPIENSRFEFVIQAAAAASIEFYATPGIGKVELEWPPTPLEDALGYNLYRSCNLTDSTYGDTLIINTELVLDTVYADYNVIPDTTYHYFYKTLGTDMVETDYSKKATATPFDAANGDANGDQAVNVLDITTIVSYMLNQSPNPFLFDAADVNYDDDINVLDIIGLVQLINGKKSSTTQPLPEISNETAYYYFDDNKVEFESKGNVAALQFKVRVKSQESRGRIRDELEKLRVFSLAYGFEFAYDVVGNEILGILYSLNGKQIPEGVTQLFKFEGVDINDIEITEIFGGDLGGDYVPVLKKDTNTVVFATDAELQVSPNPFSYSTQINYTVPENGIVEIKLFDISGNEISKLENTFHNAGKHSINWNGINEVGQQLKSGIYLIQLKVRSISGNSYNKEVKVVLTK